MKVRILPPVPYTIRAIKEASENYDAGDRFLSGKWYMMNQWEGRVVAWFVDETLALETCKLLNEAYVKSD